MPRRFLLIMACLPGAVACGGSKSSVGDGGTLDGGDAGDAGGIVRPTTCTTADDTQGDCLWPDYCLSGKCVLAQNVTAAGTDVNSKNCDTSPATLQGMGNLDLDRQEDDAGLELLAPNSAIITDLEQIAISMDSDCVKVLGHNSAECQSDGSCCKGGNNDTAAGRAICAAGEAVMLFQGHAIDPQAHFEAFDAGSDLDAQFWWLVTVQAPINFMDPAYGAAQSGFIIPQPGWTSSGGAFVMAQCLAIPTDYPYRVKLDPVTLHFADTGSGSGDGDGGGTAGNSFCVSWVE